MVKMSWQPCTGVTAPPVGMGSRGTHQNDFGDIRNQETALIGEDADLEKRGEVLNTWAMLVPRKGTEFPWLAKRAAEFIEQIGHNRVTLRCDNETALEAWARQIVQARQEWRQTVPERPPVGESQSNGIIECTVGLVAGQARTLKGALDHRIGVTVPVGCEDTVLVGGVCHVPDEQV